MDAFASLPTELIESILQFLHPTSIYHFSLTAKRYHAIALGDTTWLDVAFQVIRPHCTSINVNHRKTPFSKPLLRTIGPLLAPYVTNDRQVQVIENRLWLWIYADWLTRVGWVLGRWLTSYEDAPHANSICQIRLSWDLDNRSNPPKLSQSISVYRDPIPGVELDAALLSSYPVLVTRTHGGDPPDSLVIQTKQDDITVTGHRSTAATRFKETPVGDIPSQTHPRASRSSPLEGVQFSIGSNLGPPTHQGQEIFEGRTLYNHFDEIPFPTPVLQPYFPYTTGKPSHLLPPSPGDVFEWERSDEEDDTVIFTRIDFPSSDSASDSPSLLQPGIYIAPYSHGWEYVSVQIRTLTEEDFKLNWAWEGHLSPGASPLTELTTPNCEVDWTDPANHLGPFSPLSRLDCTQEHSVPIRVSEHHVRPGARILEVVKITGDTNVPKGQRSVLAFLDDPLVPSKDRTGASYPEKQTYQPNEHPWPVRPFRPDVPFTEENVLEEEFAPSRGVDLPGCARVAWNQFSRPQWIACTVHVESRSQFYARWHDLGTVAVFTKVEGW